MEVFKIEILNPKAMQLIKRMQDLNLIKILDDKVTALQAYLKKPRKYTASAPSLEEIAVMVDEVRTKRYAKR